MQNTATPTVIPSTITLSGPLPDLSFPVSKQACGNPTIATTSAIQEDYSRLLDSYAVTYQTKPPYLEVGEPIQNQGWILHLSVISAQYKNLLKDILPELISFKVTFKIVKDQQLLKDFNNGVYGNQKVGKAITLLIEDELDIQKFLQVLIAKTENYSGPPISTDNRICHNLYYRYGSFKPIILTDGYGNKERLMYDQEGNLVKDVYSTPPLLPGWLKNPFTPSIQNIPTTFNTTLFLQKHRPVQLLKSDKKGDVYKGLYYKNFLLPTWCIIKQGRMGIFADDGQSDMRDRIAWQYRVMQELENTVHVPHMIALLKDKEQSFLVMSLVNGESLAKKAFTIINNRPWWLLQPKEQKEIISYLLQTVQQIQVLHQKGYVHRDITGTNFLVTPTGKVFLVDLELVYPYQRQEPPLPFQQGTPGYMSPQQRNQETPSVTDDYYAIGALLLNCLTGIEPSLLVQEENRDWLSQLWFFFHHPLLVAFIGQCLHRDPKERPDSNRIIHFLQSYLLSLNTCNGKGGNTREISFAGIDSHQLFTATRESERSKTIRHSGINTDQINESLTKYMYSLSGNLLAHEGLWFSHVNNPYDTEVYPLNNKAFYGALYRGVGGPLYFLSEAQKAGLNTSAVAANSKIAWQLIQKDILDHHHTAPGLYFGSSGIAVLLVKAIQSGGLPITTDNISAIGQCLNKESVLSDVLYGCAGDGLAILISEGFLPEAMKDTLLEIIINKLLISQEKDGSWWMGGQDNAPEKITGFGYGMAGIIYFLLEYGRRYPHSNAMQAAEQGLAYLMKQAIRRKDHYEWKSSDRSPTIGKWWCQGGPGIALTFLKAFEITGNNQYCHFAQLALRIHSKELSTHQLSLCHGAAGLGEIYLEAFRVTHDDQWWERASRIADLFGALQQQKYTGEVYWHTEQREFPTADLMIGSSGIAHFLLRYVYPEQICFPLLPEFTQK